MKIFVETERFILREVETADENSFFEMDSNPAVHTYLGNSPVTKIEQIQDVIKFIQKQYADNGIGRWAVEEKVTGNFVGWCGLKLDTAGRNNHTNYYEIGYRFLEKYWGKGIATETAKACVAYGFNTMNLPVIYACCDVNNAASKNVLVKVGYTLIEEFIYDDISNFWFRITKSEWEKL